MAETFDSLLKQFREVTNKKIEDNKDRSSIKLLKRTVKSLETVLATLDKFLKSKNIDVGKAYEASKKKATSLAEASKKIMQETKEKGLKATLTGKALDIKSKLSNVFASDTEKASGPPADGEETDAPKESTANKVKEKVKEKTQQAKSTFTNLKDKLKDKLSGAGAAPLEEKKSWLDRVKEKTASRKAEVEEEKKAVQAKAAGKKGGGGWLGKILGGIATMTGMMVKGIGKSIMFLGGFLVKGFSKALFGLVPGLSRGIASATQAMVGTALKTAGKGAWAGIKAVGRNLLPMAGRAAGIALRGAAMLATGPVGWVVAAGTLAYAGYKLYKYLNRLEARDDIYGKLTRLRFLMYGFNDMNKEYYSKILDLEMVMKDYVKFTNREVQITKLDSKAIEKVLEIFGVTREEKEKYAVLNTWFMKRFIPAYKAYMTALYSVNSNVYLDQIDSLKPGDLLEFISKFSIPAMIHNVTQVPTGDSPETMVKKADVDALYTNICNDIKAKAPKAKTAEEKALEENRQAAAKQKAEATAAKKESAPAAKPVAKQPVPVPKDVSSPDSEGEKQPTIKDDMSKTQAKAAGKLNKASGELAPGGMSLEGISTKLDKSKIYNLDPNVRELFTGMAKEYNALTGKNIPVNEAFRTYEDQAELYRKMPGKAAKPGNSTHEHGLAVDINSQTSQELDKMGLLRKYGFTTAIGGEKWHLEPIGVSLNPTMAKNDENFRNKAVLSSPGKGGGGYGFLENSVMKKRDTNYQLSIYNSGTDNPIDVEKVAAATAAKSMTPSKPEEDPTKISTASKIAAAPTDKATTSTPSPGYSSKGLGDSKPAGDEGEPKPNIPTSKSPIAKKENTPSLDSKNPVINTNMDIAKYAELPTETAIRQAAKMTGADEETMMTYAKIESSLNPNAKAKTSSAGGLFQITDTKWEEALKKYGSKYNLPPNADKFNPFYNALMAGEFSQDDLKRLNGWKPLGLDEPTAMYVGHHFGVSGGNKIFNKASQNPQAPVREAVSDAAYSANRQELGDNTVMGYLNKVGQKIATIAGKVFKPKEYNGPKPVDYDENSSTVKIADNNVAASTPPPTKTAKTSSESYMVRPAKVSISAASMNSSINNAPKETPVQESFKEMFSTSKMESIMGEQLTELRAMVGLLRSIDGKTGVGQQAPAQQKAPVPQTDKTIPPSSIDLSRKKITT